jgi:hypothetical protein
MSEDMLPRVHRSERRPLGAIIWFAWMVVMWAGFFALLVADWIDPVWSWVRDLPLLVELLIWVALFPWVAGRHCLDEFLGYAATEQKRANGLSGKHVPTGVF